MELFIISISGLIGGLIQGLAGFGNGIILMIVLPYFFTIPVSVTISSFMSFGINASLSYTYRKHLNIKEVIMPLIIFTLTSLLAAYVSFSVNSKSLNIGLGFLLIFICFFMILRKNNKIKLNKQTKYIVLLLGGIITGLFGIGGPLLAFYCKATSKDYKNFQANLNFIFLISGIVMNIYRFSKGLFKTEFLLPTLIGLLMLVVGEKIATNYTKKVSDKTLDIFTYGLIGISGLIKIIQELI